MEPGLLSDFVETFLGGQLVSQSKTTLSTQNQTTNEQWDGTPNWHVTTTPCFPDRVDAPSPGRIQWMGKSDGRGTTYSYAMVNGNLVMRTRTGAGNRVVITDGTEITTTHGHGNIPIAQTTKDIDGISCRSLGHYFQIGIVPRSAESLPRSGALTLVSGELSGVFEIGRLFMPADHCGTIVMR